MSRPLKIGSTFLDAKVKNFAAKLGNKVVALFGAAPAQLAAAA